MNRFLLTFLSVFALVACAQTQNTSIPTGQPGNPAPGEAVAYFSEGCFWHAEIVFQSLTGVRDAVSGYAGGFDKHPDYEKVCTGSTGHAETVQVIYDPAKVSFATLVDAFFASLDPTERDRQGPDVGSQYRSIAFFQNDQEKKTIQDAIDRINASKKYSSKVVTEVVPFSRFYPAEAYMQEYIKNHPENPYVQSVSIPDYLHFRNSFKGNYK